jgi:tripartite-type tricarboxylate transporter receptor subunit TctC
MAMRRHRSTRVADFSVARRRVLRVAAAPAVMGTGTARAAEAWPTRPVRIVEAVQWYGIVAPARTPAAVIVVLNREINRALASPALKSRLDAEGAEAAPGTPDAFGTMIVQEIGRWKPVIEQSHMKPD